MIFSLDLSFDRALPSLAGALRVGLIFALGTWLVATPMTAEPAITLVAGDTEDAGAHHGLEEETFALINKYRKEEELPPLVWDAAIAKVARMHSRDMATGDVDFGHGGFGDRVKRLGKEFGGLRGAGENVLMTDDPNAAAHDAVALWLKSPPHLHNIRGAFNYSGLGIWESAKGVIYFTQIFLKLEPKGAEAGGGVSP